MNPVARRIAGNHLSDAQPPGSSRAASRRRLPLGIERPNRSARRSAFTLFEVAISLVLVSIGVVSVLMLLPIGLKAQQMARFQVIAATKAEEMIEAFNATDNANPAIDTEGFTLWDVPSGHRSQAWDLESRLSTSRFGLMPLPMDIARRIDSDGDEIQQILADGGYLYYSQPQATNSTVEQGQPLNPPNEAQRLVIAVAGYAQQNIMHMLPVKNWPYHTPMPSPPLHTLHMPDKFMATRVTGAGSTYWNYHGWPAAASPEDFCYPWETVAANLDRDIQKVYDWREGNVHYGYFPYACGRRWDSFPPNSSTADADYAHPYATDLDGTNPGEYPSRASCIRYVQAALWYYYRKLGAANLDSPSTDPYIPYLSAVETDRWKEVQAMRFLAHAATCLTSWYPLNDATQAEDLTRGVRIPAVTLDGVPGPPDMKITHAHIVFYHERALKLAFDFAARYPYDWAVPRPAQRAIMMDYPLIQGDLFSVPYPEGSVLPSPPGNPYGSLAQLFGRTQVDHPAQWRPVSAEPIQHIGVSQTYPTNILDATMGSGAPGRLFGDQGHFNLTAPFDANERCREIVMWAVDWQAYEDFELAPSAPVDASRYPLAGPLGKPGSVPTSQTYTFDERMSVLRFRDDRLYTFRNPEKSLLFYPQMKNGGVFDIKGQPTGTDMTTHMILSNEMFDGTSAGYGVSQDLGGLYPDQGPTKVNREVFSGLYGGDRNFNKKLDRGPLPKSVRLRALSVARFNFYDPRVQAVLR